MVEQIDLTNDFVELIRRSSTDLPEDVEEAIRKGRDREEEGSPAQMVLDTILENARLARESSRPICQDTGVPIFYVHYPFGWSTRKLKEQLLEATREATRKLYLRPNAVDPLTGKNSGDNTGIDFPTFHFEEWDKDYLEVKLLQKGGGSENVSAQYKIPSPDFQAPRDLRGVRKAILDAVWKAQGKGCAPGIIAVGIGGDRASGMMKAKEQLFRKLDDVNPVPELAQFEKEMYEELNELGIGPMGFGGKTTVLGVKVGTVHRLPACFFVSIAYMCWACRRRTLTYRDGKVTIE